MWSLIFGPLLIIDLCSAVFFCRKNPAMFVAIMLSRVNHDWCWISESSTESFQLNTHGLYGFGLYSSEQKNVSKPCEISDTTTAQSTSQCGSRTFRSYLNQLLLLPGNGVTEHPRWPGIPASTSLAELRNCSSWLFIPIYILITYLL